jgi:hypothetical protein
MPEIRLRNILALCDARNVARVNFILLASLKITAGKIIEYWNKWKAHLQRMEHTRIPLQAYIKHPENVT